MVVFLDDLFNVAGQFRIFFRLFFTVIITNGYKGPVKGPVDLPQIPDLLQGFGEKLLAVFQQIAGKLI